MAEQGSELTPRYRVLVNKKARKGLSALAGNRLTEADHFLNAIAPFTPKERVPGKTKKLKGSYAVRGILQYDLPDGYRIQYWVDDSADSPAVMVEYIGPHPK